ncbi:MAG: HAMP domain-containing protein [Firmicutes bacterium]|nr:HAMP domain-containing protein [Bacillota bacterium]
MKWNSIVTKLWAAITVIMLLVIGVAGAAQTSLLENIYYKQQVNHLVDVGKKVASFANSDSNEDMLDTKVSVSASMIDGNVMILDKNRTVQACRGLGVSTEEQVMDINNPHHGPLTEFDLDKLFNGEIITHRGRNDFFKTDVLSIGIPINDANSSAGAVIIHSPLKPLAGQLAVFKLITIYTAVGGIFLATLLSLFFSRMVSRPLLDMSKVSLAMASGDFTRRIEVSTKDEVGLLANSLNTLSTRLQEKLTQLKRIDETRREFVSNVSHEIKTPLTIIQAFTEVLQDDFVTTDKERKEYLNNIEDEVQRLKRLVNDVLNLKKMEEGRDDFEKDFINLKSLINKIQEKFNALQEESGVRLLFKLDRRIPNVYCNRDRIEQVFINLIDNAVRHTPKGGEVSITVTSTASNVRIEVKDSGKGIPKEDLPMIWERFYKADKSRNRDKSGTGLGLAIVKKIVEAHGGCIDVVSEVNKGTTFTIVLPITEQNMTKSS